MNAFRVQKTVEADGELHLTELPCRRGDKVEAVIRILPPSSSHSMTDSEREKTRAAAVEQFLKLA